MKEITQIINMNVQTIMLGFGLVYLVAGTFQQNSSSFVMSTIWVVGSIIVGEINKK